MLVKIWFISLLRILFKKERKKKEINTNLELFTGSTRMRKEQFKLKASRQLTKMSATKKRQNERNEAKNAKIAAVNNSYLPLNAHKYRTS